MFGGGDSGDHVAYLPSAVLPIANQLCDSLQAHFLTSLFVKQKG